MTYNEIRNYLLNNTHGIDVEEDVDGSVETVIVDNVRKCYLFAVYTPSKQKIICFADTDGSNLKNLANSFMRNQ